MSETELSTNIFNIFGNLLFTVFFYLLAHSQKVDLWIILVCCSLFWIKALLSLYCIIKLFMNPSK